MMIEPDDEELGRRLKASFDVADGIESDARVMARRAMTVRRSRVRRVVPAGAALAAAALTVVFGGAIADWGRTPGATQPAAQASSTAAGSVAPSPVEPGCDPPEMPYADPNFTPVTGRLGPASIPITALGETLPGLDALPPDAGYRIPTVIPEGLSLQLIQLISAPAATGGPAIDSLGLYYGSRPVDGAYEGFIADGGVSVAQQAEHLWDADTVAAEYDASGRGYSRILIGPHDAVVHLGDPILRDDLRPWGIYWYDGTREWTVTGAVDPIELIELAQSIYCSSD